MTVRQIRIREGIFQPPAILPYGARELLRAAILCSADDGDAAVPGGDASDAALVRAAEAAGVDVEEERLFNPRLDTLRAGARRPLQATLHLHPRLGQSIYLRGAPEAVAERCEGWAGGEPLDRGALRREVEEMSAAGQRVLAVAVRIPDHPVPRLGEREVEEGCLLYGLVGLAALPPG